MSYLNWYGRSITCLQTVMVKQSRQFISARIHMVIMLIRFSPPSPPTQLGGKQEITAQDS